MPGDDINQDKLSKLPLLNPAFWDGQMSGGNMNQLELQELTLFNLQKLATATDNFDLSNKLGQGGFGLVYRVILVLWNEIL